jgi:predicted HAD superfamily phosphohydrolase
MTEFFFTDWEGPWVTTDFAYEIAKAFLRNTVFFERLSQYDDYLAYVERKSNYEAGDTLKLLSPFIYASGITSRQLRELSRKVVNFIPDAREAISQIKSTPVVISTAYKQFVEESTKMLGVYENVHGTEFDIEGYEIPEEEKRIVRESIEIIAQLPEIKIKPDKWFDKIDDKSKESIFWLNNFFWRKLEHSNFGRMIEDVNAVGGVRKKEIVQRYVEERNLDEVIAIGDSISDHAMLKWVRDRGVAVSFNGNEYAIENSNVAVISNTAFGEAAVLDAFINYGVEGVIKLVKHENTEILKTAIEDVDIKAVIEESIKMRKKLRGEAGKLG